MKLNSWRMVESQLQELHDTNPSRDQVSAMFLGWLSAADLKVSDVLGQENYHWLNRVSWDGITKQQRSLYESIEGFLFELEAYDDWFQEFDVDEKYDTLVAWLTILSDTLFHNN